MLILRIDLLIAIVERIAADKKKAAYNEQAAFLNDSKKLIQRLNLGIINGYFFGILLYFVNVFQNHQRLLKINFF